MAAGPLPGFSPEEMERLRQSYEPYRPGQTYLRPSPTGSLTASPPPNPIDRVRNAVTDTDYFRSLAPEAQRVITGSADIAEAIPPVAAARGGYDVGAGAAAGDYGRAIQGAVSAVPEVGKVAGPALGAASHAMFVPAGFWEKQAAKKAFKKGATPEDVWQDTGVGVLPEKKWFTEVDDTNLTPVTYPGTQPGTISSQGAVSHPELFKREPWLAQTDLTYVSKGPYEGGAYYPGSSPPAIDVNVNADAGLGGPRSILAHELQHPIQYHYGWSQGNNPNPAQLTKLAKQYEQENLNYLISKGAHPTQHGIKPGQLSYHGASGEDLARNVQNRLPLSETQRRVLPPWETSDLVQAGMPRLMYGGERMPLRKGSSFDAALAHLWNVYDYPGAPGWGGGGPSP